MVHSFRFVIILRVIEIYMLRNHSKGTAGDHQQSQEDRDLKVPLNSESRFVQFIMHNKEISLAYKPTIVCLLLGMLAFLITAIYMLLSMQDTQTLTIQYFRKEGTTCQTPSQNCTITFNISTQLDPPVFVSYQLDSFYQNQRLFVQSKSNSQLQGNSISEHDAKLCRPFVTNSQMGVAFSWNGTQLDPNATASPCGAIAKYFFNDTFALYSQMQRITINESGISWPGDKGQAFRQGPNSSETQWIDPQDEHFIVWMRTAGIPSFQKLWGTINQTLAPGQYQMVIESNYFIEKWSGSKYFVLSTIGMWGGTNYLLPIILLLVSLGCLIAIVYVSKVARTYVRIAPRNQ